MRFRLDTLDANTDVAIHEADRADLDALADHCRALHNSGQGNGKDQKLVMRADAFTIQAWCDAKGITWQQFWRDPKTIDRFLMDPDNSAFRVWKGRL
jgi:hypothetical protein